MDELERRMTDVQDIMLSLTDQIEKLDATPPPPRLTEQ